MMVDFYEKYLAEIPEYDTEDDYLQKSSEYQAEYESMLAESEYDGEYPCFNEYIPDSSDWGGAYE